VIGLACRAKRVRQERHASASPFRDLLGPGSTMRLVTTRPGPVAVQIFDASGRVVRDVVPRRSLAPGMYQFSIPAVDGSGRRLGNGIFFYRVESNEGVLVGRLAVLK
jgi:hypothetical protein